MRLRTALVAVVTALFVAVPASDASALHWETWEYDRIAWSWEYYAPYSEDYNCLAYSLGYTDRWLWPWSGDPSPQMVTDYMSRRRIPRRACGPDDSPEIIAYSPWPTRGETPRRWRAVDHFAVVVDDGVTRSKWGKLELMTSYSWSPYYWDSYGFPVAYYKVQEGVP